ncbi:MAG TPA: hypothetical protein VGN80_11795 [Devosiaceae bacterium]|nr:hypothetical protein [Devosiaceae bacterium]
MIRALFRHPRRLGFVAFNVLIIVLLALQSNAGSEVPEASLYELPNLIVGYLGTTFLLTVWAGGWVAWTWMVLARRRRLRQAALSGGPKPRFG